MDHIYEPGSSGSAAYARDVSWSSSMNSYNLRRSLSAPESCNNEDESNKGKSKKRNMLKLGFLALFNKKISSEDQRKHKRTKSDLSSCTHNHDSIASPLSSSPMKKNEAKSHARVDSSNSGIIEYLVEEKSAILKTLRPHDRSSNTDEHGMNIDTDIQIEDDVLDLDIPFPQSPISSGASHSNFVNATAAQRALQIPEILLKILGFVDEDNLVPRELAQKRRKPMSLRHAILIYGDHSAARQAWTRAQNEERKWSHSLETNTGSGLYSCLFVNRLWYTMAADVLYKKLHFKNEKTWNSFVSNSLAADNRNTLEFKSSCLVVHKITAAHQMDVDKIAKAVGGNLRWLEFYTCPSIVPTRELLTSTQLKRLVLPGCSKVNNKTVALIAQCCPKLEHLDLRACEQVSDWGLKQLAKRCPELQLLNVGRTGHGELITTHGVKHIVRHTNVNTLGLAGCMVDDKTMWEIALRRGPQIERLSLNNCKLLTNDGIPRILKYTKNLSVLELRGCVQITDMRSIILFKRARERLGHPPLIEGCEVFELRMKEAEWMMELEVSRSIIADCLEWIYADDDDVEWRRIARSDDDNDSSDGESERYGTPLGIPWNEFEGLTIR